MTKAEIIARIDEKVGFSKKQATDVVEATFEIIKSCLEKGGNVKISGFGRFVVRSKNPRRGRSPKTGDRSHCARMQFNSSLIAFERSYAE